MAYSAAEIAQLESRLALYLEAEAAILRNQSYELDGRKLVRANLQTVRDAIGQLRGEVDRARGTVRSRGRARRGVIM